MLLDPRLPYFIQISLTEYPDYVEILCGLVLSQRLHGLIFVSLKMKGGLGLRNSKTWNKDVLYRVLWEMHIDKNNLWIS